MNLRQLLNKRRRAVLDDWFERIAASYPAGKKQAYLKLGKDRFENPVGTTLSDAVDMLFDALLQGAGEEELGIILDAPVRLRAVQRFTPAEAVGFVFDLKPAVRSVLAREIKKGGLEEDLYELDGRIDAAALVAFDTYMSCREHMLKLRAIETRNAAQRLLERAGLALPELPGDPPRPPDGCSGNSENEENTENKEEHRQGVTG